MSREYQVLKLPIPNTIFQSFLIYVNWELGQPVHLKQLFLAEHPVNTLKIIIDNIYLGLHSQNESITYSADGSSVIFENSVK